MHKLYLQNTGFLVAPNTCKIEPEPETHKIKVLDQYQTHTRYRFSSRTIHKQDTGSLAEPETHKIQVLL